MDRFIGDGGFSLYIFVNQWDILIVVRRESDRGNYTLATTTNKESIMTNRIHKYDEIKSYIEDMLEEVHDLHGEDLHYRLFNEDYYIIGTWNAKQWLGDKVFDCIETVREYEMDNFGEHHTDISSPEKLVNMYAYIIGEQIINSLMEEDMS